MKRALSYSKLQASKQVRSFQCELRLRWSGWKGEARSSGEGPRVTPARGALSPRPAAQPRSVPPLPAPLREPRPCFCTRVTCVTSRSPAGSGERRERHEGKFASALEGGAERPQDPCGGRRAGSRTSCGFGWRRADSARTRARSWS